jgi:hypothetical protein
MEPFEQGTNRRGFSEREIIQTAERPTIKDPWRNYQILTNCSHYLLPGKRGLQSSHMSEIPAMAGRVKRLARQEE